MGLSGLSDRCPMCPFGVSDLAADGQIGQFGHGFPGQTPERPSGHPGSFACFAARVFSESEIISSKEAVR